MLMPLRASSASKGSTRCRKTFSGKPRQGVGMPNCVEQAACNKPKVSEVAIKEGFIR